MKPGSKKKATSNNGAAKKDEQAPVFPRFSVPTSAYRALQILFNDGVFTTSNNLAKGGAACQAEAAVRDRKIACPNKAVIKAIHIDECGTCHRKKKVVEQELCLDHAALHWGAKEPVTLQTEMEFAK